VLNIADALTVDDSPVLINFTAEELLGEAVSVTIAQFIFFSIANFSIPFSITKISAA
jgi:hypothetical protein